MIALKLKTAMKVEILLLGSTSGISPVPETNENNYQNPNILGLELIGAQSKILQNSKLCNFTFVDLQISSSAVKDIETFCISP